MVPRLDLDLDLCQRNNGIRNTSFTSTIFSKYAHSTAYETQSISLLPLPQPPLHLSCYHQCRCLESLRRHSASGFRVYSCHCDTIRPSVIGPWGLPDYTLRSYRPFFPKSKITYIKCNKCVETPKLNSCNPAWSAVSQASGRATSPGHRKGPDC